MGRSKKLKRAFDFFYKHNELRGLESISIVFERRRKALKLVTFCWFFRVSLSLCESSFSLLVLEAHQKKVELCVLASSHEMKALRSTRPMKHPPHL